MGDRSRTGWDRMPKLQTIHKAIRQFDQRDEDQYNGHRGWQKHRKDKPAEASNPPAPSRPPYGYAQQVFSDPGPQTGQSQGYGSSPPQAAGWPPPPQNQHSQGQYVDPNAQQSYHQPQQGPTYQPQTESTYQPQTGSAYQPQTGSAYQPQTGSAYQPQTGSAYQPQTGSANQPSFQTPYGQNQQAQSGPLPGSSAQYGSHNQGYQSPPQSSGGYHQGSQSSQPYSSSADPNSQGITHNTQSRSMGPSAISGSYGGSYNDQSLSRIASAPAAYQCKFNIPNGLCTGCNYHDRYGRPHR